MFHFHFLHYNTFQSASCYLSDRVHTRHLSVNNNLLYTEKHTVCIVIALGVQKINL